MNFMLNNIKYLRNNINNIYVYNGVHRQVVVAYTPLQSFLMGTSIHTSQARQQGKVTFKPYIRPAAQDHDYKNMRLRRPMSPHLTIHAPTVPAMTSISQRISGAILTFYALMLSGGSLFLSNGVDSYVSMIQSLELSSFVVFLLKIICGIPFSFHYFNGIRFCAWNAGKWLKVADIYDTAKKAAILSLVLTLLFALR